jgi:mannose-6-phosphate isomerase-like protein (cupin superfamily)
MVEANGTTLVMYRLNPGTHFEVHSHPVAELGVVLSGRGRARFGAESRVLETGDAFYIPPGLEHDFRADATTPVVLLNVTVPLQFDDETFTMEELQRLVAKLTTPRAPELAGS